MGGAAAATAARASSTSGSVCDRPHTASSSSWNACGTQVDMIDVSHPLDPSHNPPKAWTPTSFERLHTASSTSWIACTA